PSFVIGFAAASPAAARKISWGGLVSMSLLFGVGNAAPSRWKSIQSNVTPLNRSSWRFSNSVSDGLGFGGSGVFRTLAVHLPSGLVIASPPPPPPPRPPRPPRPPPARPPR